MIDSAFFRSIGEDVKELTTTAPEEDDENPNFPVFAATQASANVSIAEAKSILLYFIV